MDEGHRLKSGSGELYKALSEYPQHFRVLLTGTPVQNKLDELFNLLRFLDKKLAAVRIGVERAGGARMKMKTRILTLSSSTFYTGPGEAVSDARVCQDDGGAAQPVSHNHARRAAAATAAAHKRHHAAGVTAKGEQGLQSRQKRLFRKTFLFLQRPCFVLRLSWSCQCAWQRASAPCISSFSSPLRSEWLRASSGPPPCGTR